MCQWNWIVSQLNIGRIHKKEVQKHSKLLQNMFLDLLSAQEPVRGLVQLSQRISQISIGSSMFFLLKKHAAGRAVRTPLIRTRNQSSKKYQTSNHEFHES